ncbi:MAG: DUF6894 family protein [Xanthobacteraceae bacterium]|jgi:hypothetical protein
MAKYFFHIKHGNQLIRDEEGSDLADPAQAYEEALKSARELLAMIIKEGRDLSFDAFIIADAQGEQVMFVPLTEALPKQLKDG